MFFFKTEPLDNFKTWYKASFEDIRLVQIEGNSLLIWGIGGILITCLDFTDKVVINERG